MVHAVDPLNAKPAYVPPGYALTSSFRGELFAGFRSPGEQTLLIYTRGWSDGRFLRPLAVHIAPPDASPVLFGTERREGEPIEVRVDRAVGRYHDGRWSVGAGTDQIDLGPVVVHWDFADEHSVTVQHPRAVCAVRGSRLNGVGIRDLLRILRSVPVFDVQ